MMNQYIIDEDQLLDTKSYIYHEDEVAFERIYRVVLSHPYNPQYQCGDDCEGECSGEVDGVVHCPYTPQAARDAKELFRDEIAKWKDEDPLFMAYVYGQKAGRKEEREKVLDKLCKICPFLDERPETCENCVVETVRKELHMQEQEQP
jgi:hypothetical protein